MVWDAIFFDSQTPLVVISSTLAAQRYVSDVLPPAVSPFVLRQSVFTFQNNNAMLHMERVPMNCLQICPVLPSSARSPDLSPIEHIWDEDDCNHPGILTI